MRGRTLLLKLEPPQLSLPYFRRYFVDTLWNKKLACLGRMASSLLRAETKNAWVQWDEPIISITTLSQIEHAFSLAKL